MADDYEDRSEVILASDLAGFPVAPPKRRDQAPIEYANNEVRVRGEALDQIWWRGRQWAVTAYGIECLDGTYVIERGRLGKLGTDHGWPEHMSEKTWVDIDDFITAYLVAIAMHGAHRMTPENVRRTIARSRIREQSAA